MNGQAEQSIVELRGAERSIVSGRAEQGRAEQRIVEESRRE